MKREGRTWKEMVEEEQSRQHIKTDRWTEGLGW